MLLYFSEEKTTVWSLEYDDARSISSHQHSAAAGQLSRLISGCTCPYPCDFLGAVQKQPLEKLGVNHTHHTAPNPRHIRSAPMLKKISRR
jgi:hypothetical protein